MISDPIIQALTEYIVLASKYAIFLALVSKGVSMIVKAFTGKENFI